MQSDRRGNERPAALLTTVAEQLYGARRARDLGAQIKAVGAAIESVRGYSEALDVTPWTALPTIEPEVRPVKL